MNPIQQDPLNPFPWYAQMRQNAPVAWNPEMNGWMIFRYQDIERIFNDPKTFSSEAAYFSSDLAGSTKNDFFTVEKRANPLANTVLATDPPHHRQLRSLVQQAFTPHQVEALAPRIRELAYELVEPLKTLRQFDFVQHFAALLPVTVIAEILGIPASERNTFKRWSDMLVSGDPTGGQAIAQYFTALVAERRHDLGDDLISGLIRAETEGTNLTAIELLGFCMLLLIAGNETTTNLLGNALLCFNQFPQTWQDIQNDRTLIPNAVEEVLRYRSPSLVVPRVAVADTEVNGQAITKGQLLILFIGSANHDEAEFPDAEAFKIARTPNHHLAFGRGIHFCLGAPLARLEAKIAFEVLTEVMPKLHRVPGTSLEKVPAPLVYGVRSLLVYS